MVSSVPTSVKIDVKGNVENGNIVVGDNNFIVNTNHGTIVYKQAKPQVRLRDFAPQAPRAPRGFLNRAAELQKLESWISSNEMVLIHGSDGMGKSALLRQAANGQAGRDRPNGVILVESENSNESVLGTDDIIQRLFDALFESDPPLKVDANTARTYLSNTRTLLLLDEIPLSSTLQRVIPDLFPNGAMLFTSDTVVGREDFLQLPIGPLPREAAVRLLVSKAGLEISEQNQATLDAICARLDDISLAIVITGNVMRETGATLVDTLKYLEASSDSAVYPKQAQSMERGLDWAFGYAFSRLSTEEQEILSTAALTPGLSMTPEWLAAAFGSEEAAHLIERLKAFGLLVANSPRLRVPPGIRIPARRASTVDENDLVGRLADFLLSSAEREPQNWDFFSGELGNLSGALTWAVRTKNWHVALRLARALDPYLSLRGLWDAWRDVLDTLLEAARQSGNRAVEAFALHQTGVREIGMGARERALELLRQALEIRRQLGDTTGMAYTQHNIDWLIGPPAPPRDNEPKPQPPKAVPTAAKLFLLVGTVGVVGIIGLALLGLIIGGLPFNPLITDTPSATAVLVPTKTPTFTLLPPARSTFTPIPVIPVLNINVENSVQKTAFLYQGDPDYFEVPALIRMNNPGPGDIPSFNISIFYESDDGRQRTLFRFEDQDSYSDVQTEQALAAGQSIAREARVIIPRTYEGRRVRLFVEVDRCLQDVRCGMFNTFSYSLPVVVYDFIENAPFVLWKGFDPATSTYDLKFNGEITYTGSARLDQKLTLEDGFHPYYALYTHPTWASNGTIFGTFDVSDIKFSDQDQLIARVGHLDGAAGDGVVFRIGCVVELFHKPVQGVSFHGNRVQDGAILWLPDQYDGTLEEAVVPLPADVISRSCSKLEMRVDAGASANSDWAVWLSAYIARP